MLNIKKAGDSQGIEIREKEIRRIIETLIFMMENINKSQLPLDDMINQIDDFFTEKKSKDAKANLMNFLNIFPSIVY